MYIMYKIYLISNLVPDLFKQVYRIPDVFLGIKINSRKCMFRRTLWCMSIRFPAVASALAADRLYPHFLES